MTEKKEELYLVFFYFKVDTLMFLKLIEYELYFIFGYKSCLQYDLPIHIFLKSVQFSGKIKHSERFKFNFV